MQSQEAFQPPGTTERAMRVLVVDDEPGIRSLLAKVLSRAGGSCEMAGTAEEALIRLARERFDIAILDLRLPGMDGLTLARTVSERHPDVALVMITGVASFETAVTAMQAGAVDYLVKPVSNERIVRAYHLAVQRRRLQLDAGRAQRLQQTIAERSVEIATLLTQPFESAQTAVSTFLATLRTRSPEAAAHAERVATLSRRLAVQLQLPADEMAFIWRAAAVHDIGKVTLPDALFTSDKPLATDEIQVLRRHPEFGQDLLRRIPLLADCGPVVLAQLEHYDGSGWPMGLRADRIPVGARIVALANVYDVMTHRRPYAPQQSSLEALQEIEACIGTQFDPTVGAALFALFDYEPTLDDWDPDDPAALP